MSNAIRIKKRASGGAAGAPAALRSSELAFNEQDSVLYYGFGDDGSANATSIISIGGTGAFVNLSSTQSISGDKTFTGSVDLTGATATAATQTAGTNNTSLATTAFVSTAVAGTYQDPLTTNGDLLYYNSSTTRLPVGTNGQVLTVNGGLPSWQDATTVAALGDLTDVTITAAATGEFLRYNGTAWVDTVLVAGDIPSLDTSKITTGTFVDARIAQSNVTQHQAALSITESQISDLDSYVSKTATGTESMAGSLTIAGDLTVEGTTTTINTTDVLVEDKNIVLGNVTTPTDATADGGGISLLGATTKTFNWVDATDAWTASEHMNLAATKEYRLNGVTVLGYNGATEILDNVEIDGGTF
jgi:hypothetical protein